MNTRLLPLLALLPMPALAQEEVLQPPPAVAPDALTQARQAAARGDPAEALSRYLRVLAARPDDPAALAGAGRAALDVGDVDAAAGFFARADARDPRNGQVKAGLADVLLQRGDARGALRYFRDATGLGVAPATIAADRGLAYDLRGDPRRAQADYQLALAAASNDETIRRLALSQAIAGDRAAALATLDPLLRRQDVPAWRTRAFVFALTGDAADALAGAALVMRRDQLDALAPYLPRLAALKPAEKAAAVHLGRFPNDQPTRLATAARPATAAPAKVAAAQPRPAAPPRPATDAAVQTASVAAPHSVAVGPVQVASALPARSVPTGEAGAPVEVSTPGPTAAPPSLEGPPIATTPALAEAPPTAPLPGRAAGLAVAPAPAPVAAASSDAGPSRAERLADERARKVEAAARHKADEKRAAEAEARAAKRRDPARHWVQVAGGANRATLGREWDHLKEKWPKQLTGRSPWTSHYRFTNRLLIGPFPSSAAAQDWVTERKKEGMPSFRVETNAGDPVERVSG